MPVIGYGTEELPAFYTRKSGFKVDYRLDTPEELAKAFYVKQDMGLGGGMLVTNPIPEEFSMAVSYTHLDVYKRQVPVFGKQPVSLPQGHIQQHHHKKARHDADRACMGMFPQLSLGDQLLHHHVDHGTGGKGQHPGHDAGDAAGSQHRQ